jgi:hypothetical protein
MKITGRSMPIDGEPVYIIGGDGQEKFVTDEGEIVVGRLAKPEEINKETELAFVPHWATCPYADQFRRKSYKKRGENICQGKSTSSTG